MIKKVIILFFCLTGIVFTIKAQTNYYLNNYASALYLGNNCFRLTQEVGNQRASVWFSPTIDLTKRFDISFTMNFGDVDANGADGMAFVLQNTKKDTLAIGSTGGSFAYVGLDSSLAVEFDTYQNTTVNDPVYDHIALISNGVVHHGLSTNIAGPVAAKSSQANIEDSLNHVVRVSWNPANDTIKVYFDCELRLSVKYNLITNIFQGNTKVRWGFTGSTGGKKNAQGFCLSQAVLSVLKNTTLCSNDTAQVFAPLGSNYNWTPATNISSTSSASPKLFPSSTTMYYVNYTDLCGFARVDSVKITMNTSPVTPLLHGTPNSDSLMVIPATYTSYKWYKNSVLIPGQTSSKLAIGTDTSQFTVVVTNASGCTASATSSLNIILPIELLSFDADYDGKAVKLNWTTASEINNDYFTIERTRDGTMYDYISTVPGAGNSNSINNYSARDVDPLPGTSFYRLLQTDYDGTTESSKLIPVIVKQHGKLKIFSLHINSAESTLEYNVFSPLYPVNIEITDMRGMIVLSHVANESSGKINFSKIAPGVFAVRVFNSTESISQKLVY